MLGYLQHLLPNISLEKFLFKKSGGIGIEIAPDKINIVQMRKQGQQYKLVKYVSREIEGGIVAEGKIANPPALATLIQETLAEAKIKTKRVTTGVPMREAIVRVIAIPAELDELEAREMILNHEAALYLPYPREEVDLDYQKLDYFLDEDGIEKVHVLLVATRREVTDSYMETFRQAGLQVDVLEINSFALIRTIKEQLQQFGYQEAAALVDIEFDNTEIAIIVEGIPQFSRTVPIGTYQLYKALSQAMNLPPSGNISLLQEFTILNPPVDANSSKTGATWINPGMASLMRVLGELSDEIRRSINFYVNQTGEVEVAQLLLAGPGSAIGRIDEFFMEKLNLPAIQIDPIATLGLQVDGEISSIQRAALGTVVGLGLRMS